MRTFLAACLTLGLSAQAYTDPITAPTGGAVGVFGPQSAGASVEVGKGSFTYAVDFDLPEARGLAQPTLSLTYNSASTDGEAGYGWSLNTPEISAGPVSGWVGNPVNGSSQEERFATSGQPLVAICTTGDQKDAAVPGCASIDAQLPSWAAPQIGRGWTYFRKQTDTDYARYFLSPDRRTWRVQLKGGILQEFGRPIAFPDIEGEALEEREGAIIRWHIVRQFESARPANLVVYRWRPFGKRGLLFLSDIWDTPRAGEAPDLLRFAHHVQLNWEQLAYSTASYAPLELAQPDFRLSRVAVSSADWDSDLTRLVTRIYRLAYYDNREIPYDDEHQAPLFHHSFLREVRQEGRCHQRESDRGEISGGAECVGLPPVTFYYQGATYGGLASLTSLFGGPPDLDVNYSVLPYLNSAAIVDFNRDGMPDVVQSWEAEVRCFNDPGNVRVVVNREDGTPDAQLVCFRPNKPAKLIRSARQMTGWLNTSTAGFSQSFTHQCMDAGDGSPGTLPWFIRESLPGGIRLASFLAGIGAPTLVGNYGDGSLLWGAGEAAFRPFRAVQIEADSTFCATPNESQGWRWQPGSRDGLAWPHDTGLTNQEDSISGPRWFSDVDGDGLPDSLGSGSGPRITAFLRSTTPFFTRRFGSGSNLPGGGSGPAQIPFVAVGDPISVVPDKDAPAGTRFFYTDINGDGLTDLAFFPPSGALRVRPGDGRGQYRCVAEREPLGCDGEEYEAAADAAPWTPIESNWDDSEERFLHDVTGDGLADILTYKDDPDHPNTSSMFRLWVNVDGHNFRCADPTSLRPCVIGRVVDDVHSSTIIGPHRVEFSDMDGNGVDDIVVLSRQGIILLHVLNATFTSFDRLAPRPGLLTRVDNGVGAVTDVHYETLQVLMGQAESADGEAWKHVVPITANVVTRLRTHNDSSSGTTLAKPYAFDRRVAYTYRDPAYDPWMRSLLGFRQVDVGVGGESAVTRTTFWYGPCQQPEIVDVCIAGSDDDPAKPLLGLPVRIDRLFPGHGAERPARWIASTELFYENKLLFDRRRDVRSAVLSASESYEYDPDKPVSFRAALAQGGGDLRVHSPIQDDPAPATIDYRTDDFGNITRIRLRGRMPDGVNADLSGAVGPEKASVLWLGGDGGGDIPGPYRCESEHWHCFVDLLTTTSDQGPDHGYMTERRFRFGYAVQGDLTFVDGFLNASYPRPNHTHSAGLAVAPQAPGATSGSGWRRLQTYEFDAETGGAVSSNRPGVPEVCITIEFDSQYKHLPSRIGRHRAGCASPSVDTRLTFDRGFALVDTQVAPSGAVTRFAFDPFGRLASLARPMPDSPDRRATLEALTFAYTDRAPLSWVQINRKIGGSDPAIIEVQNGLGERPLRFVQDDGRWIVEGWRETNSSGRLQRTYMPFDIISDPRPSLPYASGPGVPGSVRSVEIFEDIYGRPATVRENGISDVMSLRYRPYEIEARDASQILPGATGRTLLRYDGFERVKEWLEERGSQTISSRFEYALTGELTAIRRSEPGATEIVSKTRLFDSLGRLVSAAEPNSGTWLYAWDDGGRIVGTGDARGCGVNFHYDGLDRLVGEDYSPCVHGQPPYSGVNSSTGTGLEVAYSYDAYVPGQIRPDPLFLDEPTLASGQLVRKRDRAAETLFSYDNRGRVRRVDRRMATPGSNSASSFAPRLYSTRLDHDLADRVTRRTTGAPISLLELGGASEMTFGYSLRDQITQVSGSYGPIIANASYGSDGLLERIGYGDAAGTEGVFTYDARRRLSNYVLQRPAPSLWTSAAPGYTLPGPGTTQLELAKLSYAYDGIGNLTRIEDASGSLWPTGAAPQKRRDISYNPANQLDTVRTQYATATGDAPWESPFKWELMVPSAQLLPMVEAQTRPRAETYSFDRFDTLVAVEDDVGLPFDRSISGVSLGSPPKGPQQLDTAAGIRTAFDIAGNLTRLSVERTGTCRARNGEACNLWFALDWDEVGQLSRVRRWDFLNPAEMPTSITMVPSGTPKWERRNAFSAGRRLSSAVSHNGSGVRYSLDVFPTLHFRDARFSAGDYVLSPESLNVSIPGLATVEFDAEDELPRASAADQLHTFIHLPDALGSHAITLDKATGELVEKTTYSPLGATENDYRPDRWGGFKASQRFGGKSEDAESGLIDFGARFYSPYLGRFISVDPSVVHRTVANGNAYSFASGRPLHRTDPSGLVTSCGDGCYDFSDEPDRITGHVERAEDKLNAGVLETSKRDNQIISAKTLILGTAHLPIPGTDKAYFTPNGVRKVAVNAATAMLFGAIDPFHVGDFVKTVSGVDIQKPLMIQVGEDANDKSKIVGTGLVLAASVAAGGGGGGGAALAAEDAELMTLAMEVRNAGPFWMRFFRTISVATTRQGPRVVAGGASDLSGAQVARAQELGLQVVPPQPGWHAEGTLIFGAGELGLTPVRGVTTNRICGGCSSLIIEELGGAITGPKTYRFPQ